MMTGLKSVLAAGVAACVVAAVSDVREAAAQANDVYAYPLAGQGQAQQSRDRYECHTWAVQQSSFDPYAQAPPPAPPPQQQRRSGGTILGLGQGGLFPGTGLLGDAATGAGLGAAGGAIAGDAGKGAAIGAIGGTVIGGLSRAQQQPVQQESQYAQQQRQYYYQRRANYNNAFAACMQSRNYNVRY